MTMTGNPEAAVSNAGRLVLCQMRLFLKDDYIWVSKQDLANTTHLPKSTVSKKLKELGRIGLVESHASLDEVYGGYNPTLYRLTC